jgi:hypothetical protein
MADCKKYKHHIIPKHTGGTDDPSNLVELTLEEHAEEHRLLYEKYNRWQDYVAWRGLTNSIGKEEIIKLKQSLATKGKKQSKKHIELRTSKIKGEGNGMYGKTGQLNPMFGKTGQISPHYGKKHSDETCRKKRLSLIGKSYEELHGKERSEQIKEKLRKPKTEDHIQKLRKPKPKVVTRICDKKVMTLGNFMNWYKNGRLAP